MTSSKFAMHESIEASGSASLAPLNDSNLDIADSDPGFQLSFPITTTIDECGDQLSTSKTNTKSELSIPRTIISESSSKTSLIQVELLKPVFSGTYYGDPAYLVRLQLRLYSPGASRNWLSRIQSASINVILEDAPCGEQSESSEEGEGDDEDDQPKHPAIINTFSGEDGWEGPLSFAQVTKTVDLGARGGYDPFVSVLGSRSVSVTSVNTGTMKVRLAIRGRRCNILHVVAEENPIDRDGVPDFLVIPFIIGHNARRFSMRVTINARYGFVRGKLAEMWPILGRADEPLYFDPPAMQRAMEKGQRETGGKKIVESLGVLDGIKLKDYSSLKEDVI